MRVPALKPKRLSDKDDVKSFNCGSSEWETDVSNFLKEDAFTQQELGLNVTWLFQQNEKLVGYTSLVASSLILKESPDWMVRLGLSQIQRTSVPCVLVAQFGVTNDAKRLGVGSFMLSMVRGAAINSEFGVKLLTLHVDRKNIDGRGFWESQGFINFPPSGSNNQLFMVYDLFG